MIAWCPASDNSSTAVPAVLPTAKLSAGIAPAVSCETNAGTGDVVGYECTNETSADNYQETIEENDDWLERYERYYYWLKNFGAVVAYCRWRDTDCYFLMLKYWITEFRENLFMSVMNRRPLMFFAGFRDIGRGRHWDRRSRRGKK